MTNSNIHAVIFFEKLESFEKTKSVPGNYKNFDRSILRVLLSMPREEICKILQAYYPELNSNSFWDFPQRYSENLDRHGFLGKECVRVIEIFNVTLSGKDTVKSFQRIKKILSSESMERFMKFINKILRRYNGTGFTIESAPAYDKMAALFIAYGEQTPIFK